MLESGPMPLVFLVALGWAAAGMAQEIQKTSPLPPAGQRLPALMGLADPSPTAAREASGDFEAQLARLKSPDPKTRKAAIAGLGLQDNVEAVPHLGTILTDAQDPIEFRVTAAMALGRLRNWRTLPYLRRCLGDSAREIRFACALALGHTRAKETLALLSAVLERDPDWWVRFAAASALSENRDPASVSALATAALSDKEWQVRLQAVRSLAQVGSRDAAQALGRALRDPDAGLRAASAQALGEIGGLDSIQLLSSALPDESDEFPRQAISEAIKKLLAQP